MQKNGGIVACASCRHQRKKCTEKCVLAPFFPASRSREFQAVHRVFGVSNVTKIVRDLGEEDRRRAVDSLVWEAFCRQKDPVLGPYGEYRKLYEELRVYKSRSHASPHGGALYKQAQNLNSWSSNNGSNGMCNKGTMNVGVEANHNGGFNFAQNHGSSFGDNSTYSFSSDNLIHGLERMRQERDSGSVIIVPQPHSLNGLNHQYYL
ncbi:hypothetical protein U1Q18_024691 [Sarracenia purpurea var. burkii]